MTLSYNINGAAAVIPGVYSTFKVQGSLPNPAPTGRSAVILGEAEEGVPGSLLDLRGMAFTSFDEVRDFYKAGPIVDAARAMFTNQPSNAFPGRIESLFVYKTNNSTRAEKDISSPTNFGKLAAARYGEAGNLIKSQIKNGQAETKPTKTVLYLPSPSARSFRVSVNGVVTGALAVAAEGLASDFVTALGAVSGLSVTGGAARTTITSGPMTVDTAVSNDQLTITRASGTATFDTSSIQVGDVCWIDTALAISGGSNQNAGSFIVVSLTTTTLVLKQLKANEANAVALAVLTGITLPAADLKINAPVVLTVTATTITGSAATLEIAENTGDKLALGMLVRDADLVKALSSATAAVATVAATVPSAGKLAVTFSGGSMTSVPKVGDVVRIQRGSLLQGATLKNVGLFVVEAANAQSLTLAHLFTGLTTEAVTSVSLNGADDVLTFAPGFVSSSVVGKRIDSSAERKVKVEASRSTDGSVFPATLIGGETALEIGFYLAGATAAVVSIDATRTMTIVPTGAGTTISLKTLKYKTLQDLADFLNTQSGVFARVLDSRFKTLPTTVLDMVSGVGILSAHAASAYNGKLKKDYYDWKTFFDNNTGFLSFIEGTLVLKAGLPNAESAAGFLSGAVIGSTSSASVQAGLDAASKIDVRFVVPLFSRDAQYDIADGLTDVDSSYSIDSINAAAKAHVASASNDFERKYRFAMVSFDGSFDDAQQKAGELGFERCQMAFERHSALDGAGEAKNFLPWMAACVMAAGRAQAALGEPMLRKPFNLSSAYHIGQLSLFSDSQVPDFNPDDQSHLEAAIKAGLLVFRSVRGVGVRLESPDLTTRSRTLDPEGWVWERASVLFVTDEVRDTLQAILDNRIGSRTTNVSPALVQTDIESGLSAFVSSGALISFKVLSVVSLGNQYKAKVQITPAESLEAITIDVEAVRSI